MAWLAVDQNGSECIYDFEPYRHKEYPKWIIRYSEPCILLPNGTIEKILGYNLTWEDEPVEIK